MITEILQYMEASYDMLYVYLRPVNCLWCKFTKRARICISICSIILVTSLTIAPVLVFFKLRHNNTGEYLKHILTNKNEFIPTTLISAIRVFQLQCNWANLRKCLLDGRLHTNCDRCVERHAARRRAVWRLLQVRVWRLQRPTRHTRPPNGRHTVLRQRRADGSTAALAARRSGCTANGCAADSTGQTTVWCVHRRRADRRPWIEAALVFDEENGWLAIADETHQHGQVRLDVATIGFRLSASWT